jgi:hypothetical protein
MLELGSRVPALVIVAAIAAADTGGTVHISQTSEDDLL